MPWFCAPFPKNVGVGTLDVDSLCVQALENTKGTIFAERAVMLLGAKLGRDVAHKILEDATGKRIAQNKRV